MPLSLNPSPTLDMYGGNLLTATNEDGVISLQTAHYMVEIDLKETDKVAAGRSGIIRMKKHSSIAGNLTRKAIRILRRELSF